MSISHRKFVHGRPSHAQAGGITILVALSLLVLLTIAAVSMSRNSFREVVISGTSRQGAMVRNAADAGIEWSIFWLAKDNEPNRSGTATELGTLKNSLLADPTSYGKAWDVMTKIEYLAPSTTLETDQSFTSVAGTEQGFSIALTPMGKVPTLDTSFGNREGTKRVFGVDKLAPDLWAVRSDGQLQVGTGLLAPRFIHSKEAWVSTPVTQ